MSRSPIAQGAVGSLLPEGVGLAGAPVLAAEPEISASRRVPVGTTTAIGVTDLRSQGTVVATVGDQVPQNVWWIR